MGQTEEIDRYLEGLMNPEEQADFEHRLAEDATLAAELALQQKITTSLRDREATTFHQQLRGIRRQRAALPTTTPRKPNVKRMLLGLVLLLGGLAWGLRYWTKPAVPLPSKPPVQETPAVLQRDTIPIVAHSPEKNALPFASPRQEATPPSPKLLALVEQCYKKQLFPTVGLGTYRSDAPVPAQMDSIGLAFDSMDYVLVLEMAKSYPVSDPKYNVVAWTAANAAFLQNECGLAFFYGKKISQLKGSERKAQEAELLLLLTYIKCGRMDDPGFQTLLKRCKKNAFHPANQFAKDLQNL